MPVPAVDAKKLSTSSIVLGSRLVAADKGAAGVEHRGPAGPMPMMRERNETRDALMIGDRRIVPSIGNVFLRRQNLFVYFQVYGAGREADAGRPHLQTSLMLLKERKKIFESKPQTMEEWAKGERDVAAVSLSIPLRTIPQGKYVLQLHVRDVVSDTNLFRRIPLAVE
jgi:hypothetical protein